MATAVLGALFLLLARPAGLSHARPLRSTGAYAPALVISPTVLATAPGRPATVTVYVVNYGSVSAGASITASRVPTGWVLSVPASVTLPPDVERALPLIVTPDAVGSSSLSVTLRSEAGGPLTRVLGVRVISPLLTLMEVSAAPDFLSSGSGTVSVTARVNNHAGLDLPVAADVRLLDGAGQVRRTRVVSLTLGGRRAAPYALGALDVTGLGDGVYTVRVRLFDGLGRPLSRAEGWAPVAVGQGLRFVRHHAPAQIPPGHAGVTVTTVITTHRVDALTTTVPLTPTLLWETTTFTPLEDHHQVVCMPAVGDLTQDGVPDVIVSTYAAGGTESYEDDGVLRVLSGDDGRLLLSVVTASLRVRPLSAPLLVDLDADGPPEVVVEAEGGGLYAFDNGGRLKYTSLPTFTVRAPYGSAPAVADLDRDGLPEVIVGRYALDHTLRRLTILGAGSDQLLGSVVGDVDLDGWPEVVLGNTVYSGTGGIQAQNAALPTSGSNALGNFDADAYPEIVFVDPFNDDGRLWLLDHRMNVVWGPISIPRSSGASGPVNGGPPVVADFDGDGQPEIGVAGHSNYVVFEGDGTILWQRATQDYSSGATGSSVFDVQGDGRAEVAYADELHLRVYDGPLGRPLFTVTHSSITGYELPVVADVDADDHAEILVVDNDDFCAFIDCVVAHHGVRAFEASDDGWASTRRLWHQHAYAVTGVDEDLRVMTDPTPSWLLYNTFRSQAPTPSQGNTYFLDAYHALPLTGTALLTGTIDPFPVSYDDAGVRWLYLQQDRVRLRVGRLSQRVEPPLAPGAARRIAHGTGVTYTIDGTSSFLALPPLYVEAPHIVDLAPAATAAWVGGTARYTLTLTNRFPTTQRFSLGTLGLPRAWISHTQAVTVPAGSAVPLPLTVTLPVSATPQVATLLVRAHLEDGGEDVAAATLRVRALADLEASKTVSPNPGPGWGRLTYTLVITNAGPSVATGVVMSDPLPAPTALVTAEAAGASCALDTAAVSCTWPSLVSGQRVTAQIVVSLTQVIREAFTNTATVGAMEMDPAPLSNRAAVRCDVDAWTTFLPLILRSLE
jgi:uncharacterized repeat protein (TIGR01451 family)